MIKNVVFDLGRVIYRYWPREDLLNLGYFELLKTNVETDNQRDWQNYFQQKPLSPTAPDYIREALHIIDLSNMEEELSKVKSRGNGWQS